MNLKIRMPALVTMKLCWVGAGRRLAAVLLLVFFCFGAGSAEGIGRASRESSVLGSGSICSSGLANSALVSEVRLRDVVELVGRRSPLVRSQRSASVGRDGPHTYGPSSISTSALQCVATNTPGAAGVPAVYDADFALGQITSGGNATAAELEEFGTSQGWSRSQTPNGPVKFTDENGVVRVTIKEGSARAPGSGSPHVEVRNAAGERVDPYGNPVTRKSVGNHTPIRTK